MRHAFLNRWPFVLVLLPMLLLGCAAPTTVATDRVEPGSLAGRAKSGDSGALESIRQLADQGDPQARFNLGMAYAEGWAGTTDIDKAIALWEQSAQQGNADSLNALGIAHARGIGLARDETRAMALWRQAASAGHPPAQYNLGAHLLVNSQTSSDRAAAAE